MVYSNRLFSRYANKTIGSAFETAQKLGHYAVGAEHIIVALFKEPVGAAYGIIARSKGCGSDLSPALAEIVGKNRRTRLSASDVTKELVACFTQMTQAISIYGADGVDTDYLLKLILELKNSIVTRLFVKCGIDESFLSKMCEKIAAESEDKKKQRPGYLTKRRNSEKYGSDLTALAMLGKLDPVFGREAETDRMIKILCRRRKNNPCLIGEPGVGKTAVVEGLAQRIVDGNVPEPLLGKSIIMLDISGMVAGTKYRGDFEEKFKNAIDELIKISGMLIFIDELHTIVGAGAAEGAIDAASIMKPMLSRGELQIIGATTNSEYEKYIQKDAALDRRFMPITVNEPDDILSKKMLFMLRPGYEQYHHVRISDEAIDAAINLSRRYIHDRRLPDKAIDLIDEAASGLSTSRATDGVLLGTIGAREIEQTVSEWTGVPASRLDEQTVQKLTTLEQAFRNELVGQTGAKKAIISSLKRMLCGLSQESRPTGCFMFCGPSGVGKTETCRVLARTLFDSGEALIRIDMSEYTEPSSSTRLIGAPPGYIGYSNGGQLTTAIRRNPYRVVLFDEFEKAHPDVRNLLLQILEEGELTDSEGRKADFRNCIIVMTTNAGAGTLTDGSFSLGFSGADSSQRAKEKVNSELKAVFSPELLNRIDEVVFFSPLTTDEYRDIAAIQLEELCERADRNGILLLVDDSVAKLVGSEVGGRLGAREVKRAVARLCATPLSELMIRGIIKHGSGVSMNVYENSVILEVSDELKACSQTI